MGAGFLYVHSHSGKNAHKMSAKALEKLLNEETLHWAPNHPVRMRRAKRRRTSWDYVSTDTRLHLSFGIDVDDVGVASFLVLASQRR